jgi:hypothetical protein
MYFYFIYKAQIVFGFFKWYSFKLNNSNMDSTWHIFLLNFMFFYYNYVNDT